MSLFNELHANVDCAHCHCPSDFDIQFKYGMTRQLHYHLGDSWGANNGGVPGRSKVRVYGIGGAMPVLLRRVRLFYHNAGV